MVRRVRASITRMLNRRKPHRRLARPHAMNMQAIAGAGNPLPAG